jgi:dTMP kinase
VIRDLGPARFITLEGGEGTGKSTQARLLAERLKDAGIDAIATREPGGAPNAETIRRLLFEKPPGPKGEPWDRTTELLLFAAARREHLVHTIWPALAARRWVVCDRFADSTMAYQGYALGLGADAVEAVNTVTAGTFAPSLTLMLDLPVETALARTRQRGGKSDQFENLDGEFHQRLRQAFLTIAKQAPKRCRVIDASGSLESVAAAIWSAVAERFKLPR